MTPIHHGGGNQHLHRKSPSYRQGVRSKLAAYERHIQLGLTTNDQKNVAGGRCGSVGAAPVTPA